LKIININELSYAFKSGDWQMCYKRMCMSVMIHITLYFILLPS